MTIGAKRRLTDDWPESEDSTVIVGVRAQVKGFKNKYLTGPWRNIEDARADALEFFEGDWVFLFQHGDGTETVEPGFDPEWEETIGIEPRFR